MPTINIFTTDENNVPLNDLELYIDGVLVDGDFDYGEAVTFPCGDPFELELRRNLFFGANEIICNNPNTVNNDVSTTITGFFNEPFFCLIPPDPHTPNSFITVNINGNIYTQTYNFYTPTVLQMLTDVAALINADTPTTYWEAIVESGNCLRIRKTRYTANSYNGQIFSLTIEREFPAVMLQTRLSATGNIVGDPCDTSSPIDADEYLWQITWREPREVFTQTITVDTDAEVPFVFQNTLEFPCCTNWTIADNDNDAILEAGELDNMYIILATPTFDGAISNFYLVKYPCSNKVCAYEMTNIPYCYYEYNFNVTPDETENIIKTGRNVCYEYACADIYTIGLRVIRCTEELLEYLSYCNCGITEIRDYSFIEDISYQNVEADRLAPSLVELSTDRPPECDQLCEDCNSYCKGFCLLEETTFTLTYIWDYPCCDIDPNQAQINIYDNGTLIYSGTVTTQIPVSFNYIWQYTGLHEFTVVVDTCCGRFVYVYKYYVIPCKPYDLDFDWRVDCDCDTQGNNPNVRNCDCLPLGEEVIFTPEYKIPLCGCPIECETIITDPIEQDLFTEQNNGQTLGFSNLVIDPTNLPSHPYSPQTLYAIYDSTLVVPSYSVSFNGITAPTWVSGGGTGVGLRTTIPAYTGDPFISPFYLHYTFLNSYNLVGYSQVRLRFRVQFRYQNIPAGAYPLFGQIPHFPFMEIIPFGIVNLSGNTAPVTPFASTTVAFNGSTSNYYNIHGTFISPFQTSPSPAPQEDFDKPIISAYLFELTLNSASQLDGLGLAMRLSSELFINNQYIVDILISDIDLITVTTSEPIERCWKEHTVRWYINEERVKEIDMTTPNHDVLDDRLEYTFNAKGCYDVKLEVENCAGACSVEKQVCVGNPITLTKIDCYEWQITDCRRYKKCYTDTQKDNVLNQDVNLTDLNIVTLPVDTDWVSIQPDTVYYDPRADVWFYFRIDAGSSYTNTSPLIILYQDLYNISLPHAVAIYMLEYPYATNLVTGVKRWFCEKYKAIVEVTDINDVMMEGFPYEVLYYEGHTINIPIVKDGVYKVKIKIYSIRPSHAIDTIPSFQIIEELECEYEWLLIELCGIYKCYEAMFHKLQCATDCECPDEKEIHKLRQELNLFTAFFNLLNMSIEAEFSIYSTMNSIVLDSQRLSNANTIQEQLNALIKLCNKCGCACETDVIKKPNCEKRILVQNTETKLQNKKGGCCGK